MAQNYMLLARALPKLQPEEAQRVALLPVRDAVRTITMGARRLAILPAAARELVCRAVESGEHTFAAVAKMREAERREILFRPVANPIRAVTGCWDHLSTAALLIESKASGIEQRISRGSHHLKRLTTDAELLLLPALLEQLEGSHLVAKDIFDQMRARRAEMRKELRKRVKELEAWAAGQNILIAALLRKAAEGASDKPILIARSISYSDGCESRQIDLNNMGVPCSKRPHAEKDCTCGNEPPLGCPKPDQLSPRGRQCFECDTRLTYGNYCGDGDVCNACAAQAAPA